MIVTILLIVVGVLVLLGLLAASASVRVLREYERGVVFRLGRLVDERGPGVVLLVPYVERLERVSLRTVTLQVPPQEVITRDNVPARVTAVAYFRVVDPNKSIVEIQDVLAATSQIAQTTLRSVLGKAELDTLLSEREQLNENLQHIIDDQTEPWGIKVTTVEIKDVEIPERMQHAMARQAEAERERRAKIIDAEGEFQAAAKLLEAADLISRNPVTIQLRYLQTLREIGGNENSTIVFPFPLDLLHKLRETTDGWRGAGGRATPRTACAGAGRGQKQIAPAPESTDQGAARRRVTAPVAPQSLAWPRGVPMSRAARSVFLLGVLATAAGCASSAQSSGARAPSAQSSGARAPVPQAGRTALVGRSPTLPPPAAGPREPPVIWRPIPFGAARRAQTVAYVRRHYGSFLRPTSKLIHPRVIVIHYTDASFSSTYNTFASDTPDSELHELPATCAHFVIDTDGRIYQLVSLGTMCRHAVGLNWTAIGIEHVGFSDAQVLGDRRQVRSSLGRAHLYQGKTPDDVTYFVRLAANAGARTVILTNAAGGLNPNFVRGDLMLIADHINWTGTTAISPDDPQPFLNMVDAYSPRLRSLAHVHAGDRALREGVYAGLRGPAYETLAEAEALRRLGADAVGMSTVLETMAALKMGTRGARHQPDLECHRPDGNTLARRSPRSIALQRRTHRVAHRRCPRSDLMRIAIEPKQTRRATVNQASANR